MSPSYADTVKLVEDNYFHWEFNMRMKLSRKGLLPTSSSQSSMR
ncbi:hypothetical protein PF002_g29141 [Phytophthora fragariae]|uniref:Uncharacterized protein n=1 Tax=Phytophthora fragariae TaxID=53985 RepID=A0A6A3DBV1_9STRA|nr:hypothetical protein PF003_g9223 [Phytophthora fragariae]KAE8919214.1 hypothetical protein PF009_g30475 [Phytophthora fragariae]KAE9174120.1 hypothetical protein PF002_g29141 [Phytophthora fragariae]